jgi:hypothetical protein
MVVLAEFFDWRDALVIVKPETFINWHRTAFRMFWRWKWRKRGRPALPKNARDLVRETAQDNPTRGKERIASEGSLKLGIRVSPRTVGSTWKPRFRPASMGASFPPRRRVTSTPVLGGLHHEYGLQKRLLLAPDLSFADDRWF